MTGPELQELLKSQRDSLSSLDFQPASIHIAATRRLKEILTWVTYAKHIRGNKNVYRQVFAFMEVSIVGELGK